MNLISFLKGSIVVSVVTNRETYHVGEEAHLTCETTGRKDVETEIKWSKDGKPLPVDEPDSRYKRPSADVLLIERVLREDTGEYRCTARRRNMNEHETESAPMLITVKSKLIFSTENHYGIVLSNGRFPEVFALLIILLW